MWYESVLNNMLLSQAYASNATGLDLAECVQDHF